VSLRRETIRRLNEAREVPRLARRLPLDHAPLRTSEAALDPTLNDIRGAQPTVGGPSPVTSREREMGEVVEGSCIREVIGAAHLLVNGKGALE
jgi:hypothetical protein